MKYRYPAIFTPEEGGYSVLFPDLEGCYTCGDGMADALYMARDVLASVLIGYEERNKAIPSPSPSLAVDTARKEFVRFISCDTNEYWEANRARPRKRASAFWSGKSRV